MRSTRRRILQASTLATAGLARPRIAPGAVSARRVRRLVQGVPTLEGAGVRLARVIGQPALRNLDPFILLDRFHSDDPDAYVRGFPDHPHRGFETVTVMLEGGMRHRDSRGNSGVIRGGGIQWMTAGRGIVHSEMPAQDRGLLSGYQLWVNLPAREKMRAPEYQDLAADRITHVALSSGGRMDLTAGQALGARGATAPRVTEPLLALLTLADDKPIDVKVPSTHTAFVFAHSGTLLLADEDRVDAGALAVLGEGTSIRLRADRMRTVALVAAARPIGEPIVQSGPFVMNNEAEIRKAWEDYRSGALVR